MFSPPSRSQQETDLLERSNKKVKMNVDGVEPDLSPMADVNMVEETQACKENAEGNGMFAPLPTFRDKLLGYTGRMDDGETSDEDWTSDDEGEMEAEESESECPVIHISKEEKRRLRRPWRQTLIIKLLGRTIGFTFLLRKIKALWRPKAPIELVAIDQDYFLVKFASKEDYEYAKFEGPWMIFDHYLTVRQWHPNFDPGQENMDRLLVWVRIPCLPIEYYDYDFLMNVGARIGRPVKIDDATSTVSRGKFARICVEVDITKPLLSKFTLRRRVRRIEYEGIHLICFDCGCYGHRKDACPKKEGQETPHHGGPAEVLAGDVRDVVGVQSRPVEPQVNQEITESYGPWMLASRRSRRGMTNTENGKSGRAGRDPRDIPLIGAQQNASFQQHISRYAALAIEDNPEENIDSDQRDGPHLDKDIGVHMGSGISLNEYVKSKGRRLNVQKNTKEVDNGPSTQVAVETNNAVRIKKNLLTRDITSISSQSKQAAAAEEHIVVRGSNRGQLISRLVVSHPQHQVENMEGIHPTINLIPEHHQDPPFVVESGHVNAIGRRELGGTKTTLVRVHNEAPSDKDESLEMMDIVDGGFSS